MSYPKRQKDLERFAFRQVRVTHFTLTGATKKLREPKGITQLQLAEKIGLISKAVSKWETAKGLPDITLIGQLAKALGVSVMELMSGDTVINQNTSVNILPHSCNSLINYV